MSELEILFPQGKEVILKEKVFTIKPFTLGQIPKVMQFMQKVAVPAQAAVYSGKAQDAATLMAIFAEAGEDIIKLVSAIIKEPVEFVTELEMDESVELIQAIIEVNKDFFSKKVAPILKKSK